MQHRILSIAVRAVLLVLIVCAAVGLVRLLGQITAAQQEEDALHQQVLRAKAENDTLQHAIDHADDEDVIAGYAREKLGLAYDDERVFYGN